EKNETLHATSLSFYVLKRELLCLFLCPSSLWISLLLSSVHPVIVLSDLVKAVRFARFSFQKRSRLYSRYCFDCPVDPDFHFDPLNPDFHHSDYPDSGRCFDLYFRF